MENRPEKDFLTVPYQKPGYPLHASRPSLYHAAWLRLIAGIHVIALEIYFSINRMPKNIKNRVF
jgi:hypothetical protein